MSQSDEAWNDVAEQMKTLGSMFRDHYLLQDDGEGRESPSDHEVKEALRTVGESLKAAFGTVGDAFRDPEVKEEARQTAASLFDALGTTFRELGDDISGRRETPDPPSPPPPEHTVPPDESAADASEEEE